MKIKNINIHLGYLLGTVASTTIAWMTFQGTLQQHIQFAEAHNEFAFAICFTILTCIGTVMTFSNSK